MKNLYIAACTEDGGIYRFSMDGGVLSEKEKISLDRPMFLAREGNTLYALLRAPHTEESELVSFEIAEGGELHDMKELGTTHGRVACHLTVRDNEVYLVNYITGNAVKMPSTVDRHEGFGPNKARQDGPHTHFVTVTKDNLVAVTDLGTDKVYFYDRALNFKFNISVPAGYGARHLAFSPDGKYLYVANELVSSVSVFCYDGENTKYLNTYSAAPEDCDCANLGSAIRVSDGFVYMSNRGHDSIAVFSAVDGELKREGFIKTGKTPRDFNIFGNTLVCCNMDDDSVCVYRLKNGKAEKMQEITGIKQPLCVIE